MIQNPKDMLKTMKELAKGKKGQLPKPDNWPVNPYDESIAQLEAMSKGTKGGILGNFISSVKSGATGGENKMLIMVINKRIIDMRDQHILKYLKGKDIKL